MLTAIPPALGSAFVADGFNGLSLVAVILVVAALVRRLYEWSRA